MPKGIEGLDKLMKKYGELAEQETGNSMKKAVGAAVKLVQAEAKMYCPVSTGELRSGIRTVVDTQADKTVGTVYNNVKYGIYVEFGTGPRGAESHSGISPVINPSYTMSPWWIHESQIDKDVAERYHWFYLDTPDGRFYQCTGQPAQPFMYPALKNNEERVTRNISNYLAREIRKVCKQ